ncbi:hypothetical protein [Streptomyces sp. NPDC091416]|uniref:hypothetical protein n=1 Tax=Streptomyces sp. NPDC091416 TaxID=3366003 RepID=UPI003815DF51
MAVNVTPDGIPVVGVLVMVGLFGFFVWDSLRLPAGLWFRWFMPIGLLPFMAGANFDVIWLILIGVLVMATGFGMGKSWRQKNHVNWF